jgi:hypothetical protein
VKLYLRRQQSVPARTDCTLGFLFIEGLQLATIERPWIPSPVSKGGAKGVSCVPVGTYKLVRHNTEAHPMTWALVNEDLDVAHLPRSGLPSTVRTAVLIHPANYAHELRGCIAPGLRSGRGAEGQPMVLESRKAMRQLQELVPWTDDHILEVS